MWKFGRLWEVLSRLKWGAVPEVAWEVSSASWNVSDAVDWVDIKLTDHEQKEWIKERESKIFLYVLEKMNGEVFTSKRKFTNNMWVDIAQVWQSIKILSIDTSKDVNTLTFAVLDSDWSISGEEHKYADGVFFHNTIWCFDWIEALFSEAEKEYPKTW